MLSTFNPIFPFGKLNFVLLRGTVPSLFFVPYPSLPSELRQSCPESRRQREREKERMGDRETGRRGDRE